MTRISAEEHEKRMMNLEKGRQKATASKEAAKCFLLKAGIIDHSGNLAPQYRRV